MGHSETGELATPSRLGDFFCPGNSKVVKVSRAKPGLPDARVSYSSL